MTSQVPVMTIALRKLFSIPVWLLAALYCAASLAHFVHNAEYIAFYPGMPPWLTREKVYWAWFAVSSVGAGAVLTALIGWPVAAALLLCAYGAFGLDGLAHYTLALCSEHTLATNITIWSEAVSGLALMLVGAVMVKRRIVGHQRVTRPSLV
jgi:hypothetical protein